MYQIDFHKPLHIHFIGIGGISMSGLAEILLGEDFKVSGSDSKESPLTDSLTRKGARIFYGQRASNITDDVELVVYTAAIHPDNPEYASAVEKGIPMLTRAQLLGQIMRNYDTPIAVSGTHGKTTTTSMISQILLEADADPTISVGGILPSIGGNIRVGQSETFVTEACEYTNSFLSFFPNREVILNIEADHLDFFKDIDDILLSYDVDEEDFKLMNAQHLIANLAGFKCWNELLHASDDALELGKLLLDKRNDGLPACMGDPLEVSWEMYLWENKLQNLSDRDKLAIFKGIYLDELADEYGLDEEEQKEVHEHYEYEDYGYDKELADYFRTLDALTDELEQL